MVKVDNNLNIGAAVTGTFSSATGHIVTVANGAIINLMHPDDTNNPINHNWFTNITDQINNLSKDIHGINACAEIQKLVNDVMKDLQAQEKAGVGKDDIFRYKAEVQKIIDDSNKKMEEIYAKKEKEIQS